MTKFTVTVDETNIVVYEIEADDEDQAYDLISNQRYNHDLIKSGVPADSVINWDITFVEEVEQ